jgi:DNA-binding MarR family transcriptional regulator
MAKVTKTEGKAPRKPSAAELFVMPRALLSMFAAPSVGRLTYLFPRWLGDKLSGVPGLTPPRVMLMWLLSRMNEPTMGEIAQALDLTPRAITRLTDGLVEEGFVERIPDPLDGRVFRLKLTKQGSSEFKSLEPQLLSHFTSLFSCLDKTEIRELIRLSEKLSDHMKASFEG